MKTSEASPLATLTQLGWTYLPTLDEIKPTRRQQELLRFLYDWRRNSERSGIVIENRGNPDEQ